jgi:hypothetical protein
MGDRASTLVLVGLQAYRIVGPKITFSRATITWRVSSPIGSATATKTVRTVATNWPNIVRIGNATSHILRVTRPCDVFRSRGRATDSRIAGWTIRLMKIIVVSVGPGPQAGFKLDLRSDWLISNFLANQNIIYPDATARMIMKSPLFTPAVQTRSYVFGTS